MYYNLEKLIYFSDTILTMDTYYSMSEPEVNLM